MADISINTAGELKAEIVRLRMLREEQGKAIGARFSSPGATISTVFSLFSNGNRSGNILNQDFVGILSRILLPLALNKTIFRNSNFLVKGIVGFLSQKASHFISEDSVMGLWDKVKDLLDKKDKKTDYGIPPESEAS